MTQQFNTTTSMGRLTLNVLLSFAQFECEVIGDRIRDKIRGIVADLITGGAVLEYGPTEISPPFGQMFSRPALSLPTRPLVQARTPGDNRGLLDHIPVPLRR